jgi:hypothetical protein
MGTVTSVDRIDTAERLIEWEKPALSLGERPDPAQVDHAIRTKPLADRVVVDLAQENNVSFTLDGCLIVKGLSEAFRHKMSEAWSSNYKNYKTHRIQTWIGVTLLALTGRKTYGLGFLAALIWWLYKNSLIDHAYEQTALWNKPPYEEAAEQRAQAYLKPFPFLYASRLTWTPAHQTGILHQNEIEYLYKKYRAEFCQTLLSQIPATEKEKQAWMSTFVRFNPFSPSLMEYGLKTVPAAYKQLSQQYQQLFFEPLSYASLRSKFAAFMFSIGPIGPIGPTGVFRHSPYLYKLELHIVHYEQKLENLKNDLLNRKENLKYHYGKRLQDFDSKTILEKELQTLNDAYELDLYRLKEEVKDTAQQYQQEYLQELQSLKNSFPAESKPHYLETQPEKRWAELQNALLRERGPPPADYACARRFLERAGSELSLT